MQVKFELICKEVYFSECVCFHRCCLRRPTRNPNNPNNPNNPINPISVLIDREPCRFSNNTRASNTVTKIANILRAFKLITHRLFRFRESGCSLSFLVRIFDIFETFQCFKCSCICIFHKYSGNHCILMIIIIIITIRIRRRRTEVLDYGTYLNEKAQVNLRAIVLL